MVGSRGEWRPALLDPNIKKNGSLAIWAQAARAAAARAAAAAAAAWRGVAAAGSEPLKPYLA